LVHPWHAAEVNEHLYFPQMLAWSEHLEPHTIEASTNHQ